MKMSMTNLELLINEIMNSLTCLRKKMKRASILNIALLMINQHKK